MNSEKYIGLDVHQATISVAVLDSSGKLLMESILETSAAIILQFFAGLRGRLVVTFEEGTCAAWLHDLLKPHVAQLVVCNRRKNALLKAGNKSDRIDARKLAELLRGNLLQSVYHGETGVRTLRELARSYLTTVKDLTRVMNRLKAVYRSWAIPCAGRDLYYARHRAEWLGKIPHAGVRHRDASRMIGNRSGCSTTRPPAVGERGCGHHLSLCTIAPMKSFILAAVLLAALPAAAVKTMRVDYYHTGNDHQETLALDRIVIEPTPWPGNPGKAIDDTNLGKYFFEVRDRATNRVVYSRGFASIFGEWETTEEAKQMNHTFSESLRFPAPTAPVQVTLMKRDPNNAFREIWSTVIDPKDQFIDTSVPPSPGPLMTLQKSGDPANKVDFLILGDGYTAADLPKFEKDARRLTEILFSTSPFKEHRADFNVWALCPASPESGISRPSTGIHHRTPAGATYDAFGSERYILTFENRRFRDIASFAPYEFVEILVNGATYGGGGIFNLYSTVAADSLWSPYVFVHEFGHHFAGLADEYYTSDVSYLPPPRKFEPWEPNVTALLDPAALKWKDMVPAGTPLPTPWNKDSFEAYEREIQARRREIRKQNRPESEMDALFAEEKKHEDRVLSSDKYSSKVGAFEGADYEAKGYYRPQENCIMFTRHYAFCAVCQRAIERIMAMYT